MMADIDYEVAHGIACVELAKAKIEIARLAEAKRHFSELADAKGKENVALRAAALAVLESAAVIITDASHMRVPREVVGRLREALGRNAEQTGDGK